MKEYKDLTFMDTIVLMVIAALVIWMLTATGHDPTQFLGGFK